MMERGNERKETHETSLPRQLFGPPAAFGQIFFFCLFVSKNLRPFFGGRLHSHRLTHARRRFVSLEQKTLFFISIHKFYIALVEHT